MRIVGITGGIGCGKSHIVGFLRALNYPIYSSDQAAKLIVHNDIEVRTRIISLLGEGAYNGEKYDVSFVSGKVFQSETLLKKLNEIIHPKVNENFYNFVNEEKLKGSRVIFKESALIVETGDYKTLDYVFLVTSPLNIRKSRVFKRNGMDVDKLNRILEIQLSDSEKKKFVDSVIENNEQVPFLEQLLLHLNRIF